MLVGTFRSSCAQLREHRAFVVRRGEVGQQEDVGGVGLHRGAQVVQHELVRERVLGEEEVEGRSQVEPATASYKRRSRAW